MSRVYAVRRRRFDNLRCGVATVASYCTPRIAASERSYELTQSAVKTATEVGTAGMNSLLYGAPGSGTTGFVRRVSAEAGAIESWRMTRRPMHSVITGLAIR